MGKTTEDIKISLKVSLKGSPGGVFPTKFFEIKIFILKFAKTTTIFYPKFKNWHFGVKSDVWAPNCEKNHRESLICYQGTHILLEVPSADYSLSMGNFRGIFSLSKGLPLFLAISVCLSLEGSLHDFVCDRVLFSLNKEFSGILKNFILG